MPFFRSREDIDLTCRGTSLIRNRPPLLGPPYGPGHILLQVPRGWLFLMSEVPLEGCEVCQLVDFALQCQPMGHGPPLATCGFRVPMSTDGSWHGPS